MLAAGLFVQLDPGYLVLLRIDQIGQLILAELQLLPPLLDTFARSHTTFIQLVAVNGVVNMC